MDYGVPLGRRFRALKLWFVLRYSAVPESAYPQLTSDMPRIWRAELRQMRVSSWRRLCRCRSSVSAIAAATIKTGGFSTRSTPREWLSCHTPCSTAVCVAARLREYADDAEDVDVVAVYSDTGRRAVIQRCTDQSVPLNSAAASASLSFATESPMSRGRMSAMLRRMLENVRIGFGSPFWLLVVRRDRAHTASVPVWSDRKYSHRPSGDHSGCEALKVSAVR